MPDSKNISILIPEIADVEEIMSNILEEFHEHVSDTQFLVNQDEKQIANRELASHIPIELEISLKIAE